MKAPFLLFNIFTVLTLAGCQSLPSQTSEITPDEEPSVATNQPAQEEETSEEEVQLAEVTYTDFNQETYDSMLGSEPFALFFHASWCPTCVSLENDILENSDEFPEGSVIFKADFDTETALKQEYGISSQSIIVMVNAQGEVHKQLVAPRVSTLQAEFAKLMQ